VGRLFEISRSDAEAIVDLFEATGIQERIDFAAELREEFGMAKWDGVMPVSLCVSEVCARYLYQPLFVSPWRELSTNNDIKGHSNG